MTGLRVTIPLEEAHVSSRECVLLQAPGLTATSFRYATGVAAVRLANARGHVVVLPWLGQMVWDAVFDGVRLTMGSLFDAPRPVANIIDTYGCFAFHSGLLRNGCPSPEDDHELHGEMPCARMDSAALVLAEDEFGAALKIVSTVVHARGFGHRYRAEASVTLREDDTMFDIGMDVRNTAGAAMDLMYMCHINFDFVEGGRIVQPAPFTPAHVAVRTSIPAHVVSSPAHVAALAALAADPSVTERLDADASYDPEQVFYLRGLGRDEAGRTELMLLRPQGDAFAMSFSTHAFPQVVRWLLRNADHRVAAFALPATCHPEGYAAERRKGQVATLLPDAHASFSVRTGYLDREAAAARASAIALLPPPP